MNLKFSVLLLLVLLLFSNISRAQDCTNSKVYKKCKAPLDSRYISKTEWSKSFKRGQSKKFVLTFNKGYSYYISICSKENDLKTHIKLLEDNEKQDVIYDNAINEMSGVLDIQTRETKKMIIEVTAPAKKIDESKNLIICIGMRLFYHK